MMDITIEDESKVPVRVVIRAAIFRLFSNSEAWMNVAKVIDALRIMPRAVLCFYGYWMARVIGQTCKWYFALPIAARTGEVTAFVTIVVGGIFGLAGWVFKIYSSGGYTWPTKDGDVKT